MPSITDQLNTPLLISLFIGLVLLTANGCSSLRSAKPWHKAQFKQEFTANMVKQNPNYRWQDYLQQETALFHELEQHLAANPTATRQGFRYDPQSPMNPLNHGTNWNRSFMLRPATTPEAGIVLFHGLTDSPYSVRHLAQSFVARGFLVLALRVPGHGTMPSGLLTATWKDWVAASRVAVQEVQRQLGDNQALYLLGYSNGGTLALNYALDAAQDPQLPQPRQVILLSPMIGVSKFARLTKPLELVGRLPLLSSRRWLSKSPEYNPYKYNSFPVNAAWQAHRFSLHVQRKIQRLAKQPALQQLAPLLTFQSVADATVSTEAIATHLYHYLPAKGSELVLYDINRHRDLVPITRRNSSNYLHTHFAPSLRNYDLVKLANSDSSGFEVSEYRQPAGTLDEQVQPLGVSFPAGVFSLSHVALPFAMDDPLYGLSPRTDEDFGIRLGNRRLLGETKTLILNAETGMRLYCNPFYAYQEARIFRWLGRGDSPLPPRKPGN